MFFRVENMGPLREAEVDLSKRLIVLVGPNNSGKTYLAWSVYGLHRFDRRPELFDRWAEAMIQPPHELNVPEAFARDGGEILDAIATSYVAELDRCFAAARGQFDDARVALRNGEGAIQPFPDVHPAAAVIAKLRGPPERFMVLSAGSEVRWRLKFGLVDASAPNDDAIKEASLVLTDASEGERRLFTRFLRSALTGVVTDALLPQCVLFPAERIAINIFAKELALKRTELVDKLVDADLEGADEVPIDIVRRSAGRYPWPIRDSLRTANDLEHIRKETSAFASLADEIETNVLGGKVSVTGDGELLFAPNDAPDRQLGIHLTASVVKSLASLVLYFRHVATHGQFLIIDEPELNLHPDNQRKIARILAKAVNRGFKIMISTHSDYVVRELSHMIMLSKLSADDARELKFDPECALTPDKVGVYLFDDHTARPIPVEETGFSVETIDDQINRQNEDVQELYARIFGRGDV